MTAVISRPAANLRLVTIELRHNAMPLVLPFVVVVFWLFAYRKTMALAPLWDVRAANLQTYTVVVFAAPVASAAAWMGSREARRRMSDLMTITPRPRWARQLALWAATASWAVAGCLGCLAVGYGATAHQASWGGPLWWPAAVAVAIVPASAALGFAAGTLLPGRLTAPVIAIATFIGLVLSTEPLNGSHSDWQISPVVNLPWDGGQEPGVAAFYPYRPDLSIAQVLFLAGLAVALLGILALPPGSGGRILRAAAAAITAAGLLAAGTAVRLAGTGTMDAHGMISIPALHDAASDRPLRYPPVCSDTAIPVCLNPAYKTYLSQTASALQPLLTQLTGLPGAPVRVVQAAATYQQQSGNQVVIDLAGPALSGKPPVYRLLLPIQQQGPALTAAQTTSEIQLTDGPAIAAGVTGAGPRASQAQDAVAAALLTAAGWQVPIFGSGQPGEAPPFPGPQRGTPAAAAAARFAALPAATRHDWLVQHLTALRAGQITIAELP